LPCRSNGDGLLEQAADRDERLLDVLERVRVREPQVALALLPEGGSGEYSDTPSVSNRSASSLVPTPVAVMFGTPRNHEDVRPLTERT
jgi:hypothetical protein